MLLWLLRVGGAAKLTVNSRRDSRRSDNSSLVPGRDGR